MSVHSFHPDFLNHYQITDFFQAEKKGGQKSVYFPIQHGKRVVLKLFHGGKDDRFDREMKIYDKYKDMDGIPIVYLIDEYHDEVVVFEEFIEGDTLADIAPKYENNNDRIKELLSDIFHILTPVWKDRFVHRDLKPENIIIRSNGKPVILDFGIARDLDAGSITGTGLQPGTWKWAAPEQYLGQKDMISYRTDFFSIGIIAYYLYYQNLPFGNTADEIDKRFKSNDESFISKDECLLNKFLIEVMKFKPSHRPKDIEDLINFL